MAKGQNETIDAVVAWTSIVMIRYLLLVYILSKRQIIGPIGSLFKKQAHEHLQLALMQLPWERFRQILMLSSQLYSSNHAQEEFA